MNGDGTSARNVATNGHGVGWGATYSPDGTQLLYAAGFDHSYEVAFADVVTGIEHRLTDDDVLEGPAAWFPSGSKILFSRAGSAPGLYSMNSDGSGVAGPLVAKQAADSLDVSPTVQRPSSWPTRPGPAAFHDIYMANTDGSGVTDLTLGGPSSGYNSRSSRPTARRSSSRRLV